MNGGDGHNPRITPAKTEQAITTFARTVGFPAPKGWRYQWGAPGGDQFGEVEPGQKTIRIFDETFDEDADFFASILAHENVHIQQCFARPYRGGSKIGPSNLAISDGKHHAAGLVNQIEAYAAQIAYIDAHGAGDHRVNTPNRDRTLGSYFENARLQMLDDLQKLPGGADYVTRINQGNYTLKLGDAQPTCP
jgi:hypothetical protein